MNHEQEVNLLGELRGLRADLKAFCYRMSHDLQGSLRNIGGFVSLIEGRSGVQFDEKSKRYLSFVKEGTERAQALLHGLNEYADLLSEEWTLKTVSLEEALQEALEELKPHLKKTRATINTQLCSVEIFGDIPLLKKAFKHVIENALLYVRNIPHISIVFEKKMAQYVVSVTDNGIGIPETYQKTVFEPFERLHSSDQYPGVGLGLTIVKRIIEMHHGRIWVERNEDKPGTTVFWALPLRA